MAAAIQRGFILEFSTDECCNVCGDIGYNAMLVSCSRCKVSREHIYCMRICLNYPPEEWFCEECELSSGTDSPTSGGDLPEAKALPLNCSGRLQNGSARPNRLPNDPKVSCMDREKKFQTRKVKLLSPQEVIMLNSRAKKFTSPAKFTSRPSTHHATAQR